MCLEVFFVFRDRILDGSRWLKKNSCQTRKRGHYCTLLCDIRYPPPSPPSFIAYNIAQYTFPTTPFIAIKYWQYFVRAKAKSQSAIC